MKKKLLAFTLAMAFSASCFAADSSLSATQKVGAMEKVLYGTEQTGSLVSRMDSLEDDLYGSVVSDTILNRIDSMYGYIDGSANNGEASFATRLNIVDWKLSDKVSDDPAKSRIEAVEKAVNGSVQSGSLSSRLSELERMAGYTNGSIPVQETTLPKDSVMKIVFTNEMSTKTNRKGDVVPFVSADNLYVNDVLVIPKGAHGIATVSKVVQPGIFGKDGRLDLNFSHVTAVDGTQIPVYVGELAKQKAASIAGAAGVAIGSMIVLGPVGLVGGAFVKGASVTIPAGSATYVQCAADTAIQGVVDQ
ncbi:MAG: hypothetical protein Q4D21_09790 [Phascolarctobacterium sp.]|nr:hypothetical protein [Phascolarctobacterium sp.]